MSGILRVYDDNDAALSLLSALHISIFAAQGEDGWTSKEFKKILSNPVYECYVFDNLGEPYGMLLISNICGEMEIITLGVDPSKRQLGYGRRIVEALMRQASSEKVSNIHIEVRADNDAALALYNAYDFKTVGRRADYYTLRNKSKIDAVLMAYTNIK